MSRSQFSHSDHNTSSAIELVQEFLLPLIPTVNGLRRQICVLIKGHAFKRMNELFAKEIICGPSIFTCFHKASNALLMISFPIDFLKIGGLIAKRHLQLIDPFCIRLHIAMTALN